MTSSFYGEIYSARYDNNEERFDLLDFYLDRRRQAGKPEPVLEPMCGTGFFRINCKRLVHYDHRSATDRTRHIQTDTQCLRKPSGRGCLSRYRHIDHQPGGQFEFRPCLTDDRVESGRVWPVDDLSGSGDHHDRRYAGTDVAETGEIASGSSGQNMSLSISYFTLPLYSARYTLHSVLRP